jgi:hypothetical protein
VGHDVIYYDRLNELPVYHRSQIEQRIWKLLHPQS